MISTLSFHGAAASSRHFKLCLSQGARLYVVMAQLKSGRRASPTIACSGQPGGAPHRASAATMSCAWRLGRAAGQGTIFGPHAPACASIRISCAATPQAVGRKASNSRSVFACRSSKLCVAWTLATASKPETVAATRIAEDLAHRTTSPSGEAGDKLNSSISSHSPRIAPPDAAVSGTPGDAARARNLPTPFQTSGIVSTPNPAKPSSRANSEEVDGLFRSEFSPAFRF